MMGGDGGVERHSGAGRNPGVGVDSGSGAGMGGNGSGTDARRGDNEVRHGDDDGDDTPRRRCGNGDDGARRRSMTWRRQVEAGAELANLGVGIGLHAVEAVI